MEAVYVVYFIVTSVFLHFVVLVGISVGVHDDVFFGYLQSYG